MKKHLLEDSPFFSPCKECGEEYAYNVNHGSCQSCSWGYITGTLPPPIPFSAGDKVTAFGNEGFVKSVSANGYLEVSFPEAPATVIFRTDGKLFGWSKVPVLRKL